MSLTEIDGYRVVRQLGAGGMGQVFLVQHPRLPRTDALKLLDGVSVAAATDQFGFVGTPEVVLRRSPVSVGCLRTHVVSPCCEQPS